MEQDVQQTMQQLVELLNHASESYYNGLGELMSDFEWDAKFDELKQLEQQSGIILPNSPTQNVSYGNSNGQKEEHEFPTLSLAKTKAPEELVRWTEGRPIWLSWKLDGLTLVVTYDNGEVSKIVTRGNGRIGTNITHLASAIKGIPAHIEAKGHTVIRGEAVISYADFEQFNIEADEAYANPRNLASGSLTLKDVEEVKQRHIQWIPFTLVYTDQPINSWGERMDWLSEQGFDVVERELIDHPSLRQVTKVIAQWTKRVTDRSNPFPVDGLVVSFDDTEFAATGTITGHHATRGGLAFKWQDEAADTVLHHIEWSCATSTISPVAVFNPVELEGTIVKRASLCNISECERLGIGSAGSLISVIKANKIIPKVIRVSRPVGQLEIPALCPVCRHETKIKTRAVSHTRTLHCLNEACPAKQLKKFARFVSKDGMDIDGISELTLAKFINLGWLQTYDDIYHMAEYVQQLATIDGFGKKSASNILQSIEKSKNVEARQFLYALAIPMCGIDVCNRLLSIFDLHELIKQAVEADEAGIFSAIDGIGPEKSSSFVKWFRNEENRRTVERLLTLLNIRQEEKKSEGDLCKGLIFVITGKVQRYKNRAELKAYIESQGGHVTGGVTKSTHFLINNNVNSTSGKNKKAKELGIEIISEDQFFSRFTAQ